jgi:hypothetical protein
VIGLFWNIRGLGLPGRTPALVSKIRGNHVDFLRVVEIKKEHLSSWYLRSLTGNIPFKWHSLPIEGSAGGILVGANTEIFNITEGDSLRFSVSIILQEKNQLEACGYIW